MSKIRHNHSPQFKAKVAVEALQGEKTVHEIAAKYQVHPTQVTQWRRQLMDQAAEVFAGKSALSSEAGTDQEALLAKIGSLTVERDFLSKMLDGGPCRAAHPGRPDAPALPRSSVYYDRGPVVSHENLTLMRLLDELHLKPRFPISPNF